LQEFQQRRPLVPREGEPKSIRIQQKMQVLVTKLIDGKLAGRAKDQIVTVSVGSCVEGVWRCQKIRNDEQLAVQERTRRHLQIAIRQQDDLIDGGLVLDHCLIIASTMAAPDGFNLARNIEFPDQIQE